LAIQNVVTTQKIDPAKVELCYHSMMEMLENEGYVRGEVMAAVAVFLGTQWNGAVMNDDQTRCFIKDLMEWLAVYFVKATDAN
jgi:hypothetical protein